MPARAGTGVVVHACVRALRYVYMCVLHVDSYGLSEIINHLLARDESAADAPRKARPFDFLIDGEFLRTSIKRHLSLKNLTTV